VTDEEYGEIQRRGQGAKALLESEDFGLVYKHLTARLMDEWAQTAPGAQMLREERYSEIRGLRQLKTRLQALVDEADYEFRQREKRR
jgi:hypothetical protein